MTNEKESAGVIVTSDHHPVWLEDYPIAQEDLSVFHQLMEFYVFYSILPQQSAQRRTLQFYGWTEKPWKTNRYLKDLLMADHFEGKKHFFQAAASYVELADALRKADLGSEDFQKLNEERVAFLNSEKNQFISLFKHIRCAFAHGRVGVKKTEQGSMYLLEDGCPEQGRLKVSARMVLRPSTLLNWIKIIREGPQEEENSYYDEILAMFEENSKRTVKSIRTELGETAGVVNRAINHWKKSRILSFEGQGRHGRWVIDYGRLQAYRASINTMPGT